MTRLCRPVLNGGQFKDGFDCAILEEYWQPDK
jgi:hypothetical protein